MYPYTNILYSVRYVSFLYIFHLLHVFVCEEDDSNTFLFVNTHLGAGVHQQAIQHGL